MNKSTLLLIPFLLLIELTSLHADEPGKISIISRQTILAKDNVQLHFPFLYESKNKTWYMTYREGGHGAKGGDRVQCVLSRDQGKTWKQWDGLAAEPQLRFFRTQLSDGSMISHRYTLEAPVNTKVGFSSKVFIMRSTDDGATWTKTASTVAKLPFRLVSRTGGSGAMWGHIVEMPNGRLLAGVYGFSTPRRNAVVVSSDDHGKTWTYLSTIGDDQTLGNEGFSEMDIVLLANKNLLAVMRTGTKPGSNMRLSQSTDNGKTWSKTRDQKTVGVSPQLLVLKNGVLVCTYGTRDVYVMASWDGTGDKWSKPHLIYKGEGSGYTDLQAISDSTFRMVFDQSPFLKSKKGGKIVRVVVSVKK